MAREVTLRRTTKETDVEVFLRLEGERRITVALFVPFFPHLLEALAFHAGWDLSLRAEGDAERVDDHHVVEDVGIVLGEALHACLGDKKGIRRFGEAFVPMDDALSMAVLDLSGRPYLVYDIPFPPGTRIGNFEMALLEEFLRAFTSSARLTLHAKIWWGKNAHHASEALFKAVGRALHEATQVVGDTLLSTKGIL
ncbi:MAG: imidazoleglycerol-phosphate dehydratase HisB [Candidatus Caldatribacterium sp.]|uniref:imidazoleglycerol-phosphate dehydratase HisB n=1 Tax=Candidatus Caldatribacterium sp. TaxID=2282143 RepID=UPI002998B46C|nr:imidazoleglycerol-phosphate dehydratase HisB [Candidatus Caldatribacterium sp.]MCX7731433.1 imidazoleglycerol-phosphate dehydratase HisB [Candidatus Caldatribacterium sp.]MDW8081517.1 imidazoleglycerol-phosphate dehydratase HisB [Candidatus Calescibacterium sp.]